MRLIDADEYIKKLRDRIGIEPTWNLSGLRIAIFELHNMPTIDPAKWIPVSERLPEEEVQVLVTDDAGGLATIDVDCGYFDKEYGRFEWFHSQNVTAWMPLPEPYKGEEE